jgi:hypothetical protein
MKRPALAGWRESIAGPFAQQFFAALLQMLQRRQFALISDHTSNQSKKRLRVTVSIYRNIHISRSTCGFSTQHVSERRFPDYDPSNAQLCSLLAATSGLGD